MRRFWETVIAPAFEVLRPEVVVEIGSDFGGNTLNLLGFCERTGAVLHVIDPAPQYDPAEWQRKHGERLVFHEDLSLNALREIAGADAVLVDGDHNYYTVLNELRLVEEKNLAAGRPFPLVMLHDVGWPYGRRDLYYAPETVPDEHRKPHERKGMKPGFEGLLAGAGLNQHLHNATRENEPRSGVLTAVEDFLEETGQEVELVVLPGLHGLAILFPGDLKERNPEFAGFLESLELTPFARSYIGRIEEDRLGQQIRQQENVLRLKQARRDIARLEAWIQELEGGYSALLNSRQWQVGRVFKEVHRKLLPQREKPGKPTVPEHMNQILKQFHAWREERGRSEKDRTNGDKDPGTPT